MPSPNAHAELIGKALEKAKLDPRTLSYIEAHGTGTSLGDPIEISGLSKAFNKDQPSPLIHTCAIGSAKSNIGHLESAAGIAGVTKVLLQLKHKQLVPSLHSETLNPNIDFATTPFKVQQTLAPWDKPVVTIDGEDKAVARIAGISSFGAGGSNAHVIIEEYEMPAVASITVDAQHPVLIVLSAKTQEQLRQQAQNLLTYIDYHALSDSDLGNIAYTLQVGREAMEERLACSVHRVSALTDTLTGFIEKGTLRGEGYVGSVKKDNANLSSFGSDEDAQQLVSTWITKGKHDKLLECWVKGLSVDWNQLYGDAKPTRISLPTYPFAKERYWPEAAAADTVKPAPANAGQLHPLLHQNTSTGFDIPSARCLAGRVFSKRSPSSRHQSTAGRSAFRNGRVALGKTLDTE